MQLINEQNDFAFTGDNFFKERFEPVLELAAEFCAGDHSADVHGHQALVLQAFGNIAADDTAGETLGDGSLANAWFTDKNRVVFGATREHLHDAPDFFIAPNDGINFALASEGREVATVFFKGLKFVFRVGVGDALIAAQIGKRA